MIVFLILSVSFFTTAYLYFTRHFNYWKNRGIFYLKPTPFIGNLGPIILMKYSIGDYLRKIYEDHENEPYVGIFMADKPSLVIRDFNLVCRILKQDFNYFNNRILTISKKTDPLGAKSLFSIHGKEWKNTRAKLSPIFTSKKQKNVFSAMLGVQKKLENKISKEKTIEIKELSSCVASDMISDAVFRMDGQAIYQPDVDPMRKMGNRLFEESVNQGLRSNMVFLAPEMMDALNISLFPETVYRYVRKQVSEAMSKGSEERRGDYLDSLIDLRMKGSWEGNNGEIIEPNDEVLVGQIFMFYTAGFETVASGTTFCLFEAAKNMDLQMKLKDEINNTLEKCNGNLTFEDVSEMTYITSFINECLRKHPPFPFVDRVCTMDYTIPGSDVVIEKGTKVMIPMLGLQNDKKYYEDPDSITPERFEGTPSETEKPFLPFGNGPRQCLGMRFALVVMKLAIIGCLSKHTLSLNKNTPRTLKMSPRRFGSTPLPDVFLDVSLDDRWK